MTPDEFASRMSVIEANAGDIEHDHSVADDLLCEALTELGFEAGAAIYEKLGKWYA